MARPNPTGAGGLGVAAFASADRIEQVGVETVVLLDADPMENLAEEHDAGDAGLL